MSADVSEVIARIIDPLVFQLTDALNNAEGEPEQLRNDATAHRDARLAVAMEKADRILAALQEGSGALPASPSGGQGSSAAPIPTEGEGPSAGQWSRERACVAAAEASRAFREWVPQTWLTLFFNAYEGQPEGYRKPLLGPPGDMMVSAILLAGVPEIDAKRADQLAVTITDAIANTPSMGIREANETQPNQPRDREEG